MIHTTLLASTTTTTLHTLSSLLYIETAQCLFVLHRPLHTEMSTCSLSKSPSLFFFLCFPCLFGEIFSSRALSSRGGSTSSRGRSCRDADGTRVKRRWVFLRRYTRPYRSVWKRPEGLESLLGSGPSRPGRPRGYKDSQSRSGGDHSSTSACQNTTTKTPTTTKGSTPTESTTETASVSSSSSSFSCSPPGARAAVRRRRGRRRKSRGGGLAKRRRRRSRPHLFPLCGRRRRGPERGRRLQRGELRFGCRV